MNACTPNNHATSIKCHLAAYRVVSLIYIYIFIHLRYSNAFEYSQLYLYGTNMNCVSITAMCSILSDYGNIHIHTTLSYQYLLSWRTSTKINRIQTLAQTHTQSHFRHFDIYVIIIHIFLWNLSFCYLYLCSGCVSCFVCVCVVRASACHLNCSRQVLCI